MQGVREIICQCWGVKSRHATCTHRFKVRVDKTSFIGRKRRVVHEVSEDAIEILDSMWGNHGVGRQPKKERVCEKKKKIPKY